VSVSTSISSVAIVIPVFNEASNIEATLAEIQRCIVAIDAVQFTIIVVDDGSADNTADLVANMQSASAADIRLVCLNRNFGKESAIYAGLVTALKFDAVIVMDGDLQHPPKLISEMIGRWRQGFPVVEAVKSSRGEEAITKSLLVRIYYRLFNYLSKLKISGDTDFKLLDRSVVLAYCALPEHSRFFRGLVKWMGHNTAQISFDVPITDGNKSSWSNRALFRYALSSLTSFTAFPLQIVTLLGGVTFLISIVIGGIALFDKLSGKAVDGFTTVILLLLITASVLMFSVGLIGIYVGKIYDEVKKRPNYLIDKQRSKVDDLL